MWIILVKSILYNHWRLSVSAAAQKNFHKNHSLRKLALTLFMLRILANYSDTAFSFDDFAFFANGLYRWSYFHRKNPPFTSCVFFCLPTTGFWSGNLKKTRHFLFPIFTKTTEMRTKNRRNDPVKIILEYSSISISKLQEFFWKFQKSKNVNIKFDIFSCFYRFAVLHNT